MSYEVSHLAEAGSLAHWSNAIKKQCPSSQTLASSGTWHRA